MMIVIKESGIRQRGLPQENVIGLMSSFNCCYILLCVFWLTICHQFDNVNRLHKLKNVSPKGSGGAGVS